jgi:TRAP-type C4-dicarboxylate transport system permease small subunit
MDDGADRLGPLQRVEYGLLELSFLALVAMNATNVFARYVLNRSIGSLFEVMVLLSIATYWLGIATAESRQMHLGMNLVTSRLRGAWRRIAEVLRLAVIAAFLLAAAYSAGLLALSQWRSGATAGTLGVPLWPFTTFIPLGCLVMLWRSLAHGLRPFKRSPLAPPASQGAAP